jgi:hypothetical protein
MFEDFKEKVHKHVEVHFEKVFRKVGFVSISTGKGKEFVLFGKENNN